MTPNTPRATTAATPTPTRRRKRARIPREYGGPSDPHGPLPRGKGIPVVIGGYTLSDIARACDLDQSYLSRVTLGKATPSVPVLMRIQAFLDLPSLDATLRALAPERVTPTGERA